MAPMVKTLPKPINLGEKIEDSTQMGGVPGS